MGHRLFAVLVPATVTAVTAVTVGPHLLAALAPLLRDGTIDALWLGGQASGAWDRDYDPTLDPANWRPCTGCGGGTRPGRSQCRACADAAQAGRAPGTGLALPFDWASHPGDLVPLPRLLDPAWRFPKSRTPIGWADPAGVVWLDPEIATLTGTDTGEVPPVLRQVFHDPRTGGRHPSIRSPQRFDPADYLVAAVDAHT
jgi:hypothetical protein